MFESSVILDGNNAITAPLILGLAFESSVILDGNNALFFINHTFLQFESSVILDGNNADVDIKIRNLTV